MRVVVVHKVSETAGKLFCPKYARTVEILLTWASLVAQLVKNLPAVWETWVRSLGWKDPLEKGKAIHSFTIYSSILAWRIPWTT